MATPEQPPPSWHNTDILFREVHVELNVIESLVLHGLVAHALQDPYLPASTRAVGKKVLNQLEAIFNEAGLEEPEQGWRGLV